VAARHFVVLSNRSPCSVVEEGSRLRLGSAVGGLASALRPLAQSDQVTWIAAANSRAERRAAIQGLDGNVHFVAVDEQLYRGYYDEISNSTLWFVHHGMYDRVSGRPFDAGWLRSWDSYRAVNRLFAKAVARSAPAGSVVLVQDYHLCLAGAFLRADRPDLRICHFSHTPFASPAELEVLPTSVTREMLESMSCYDLCGFHCSQWEEAFRASCESFIGQSPKTFVAPLGPDPVSLEAQASSSACQAYGQALEQLVGGKRLIVRVDRLEPAKNHIRGFRAFDELLQGEERWRGQIVFVALAVPSRQSSPEYVSYRAEVERVVAEVNERWGTAEWTPIVFNVGDSPDRSLAALQRYDVLMVNPIRDGLNLVAMEGPLLNRNHGVLLLSRTAGAWATMGNGALAVHPFDVFGTRMALARALDMSRRERAARAAMARHGARLSSVRSWLDAHLRQLGIAHGPQIRPSEVERPTDEPSAHLDLEAAIRR
jgi:trehalose 6-phosphate synthase